MKSAIFTDDSFGYSAIEEAIEYFSVAYKNDVTAIISTVPLPWKEIRDIPVFTEGTLSKALDKAAARTEFSIVLDVTSYYFPEKFALANVIVNKGYAVFGSDYRIFPPKKNEVVSPGTIAILGNRNFGKTATVAYIKGLGAEYGTIASVSSDPRAPRYSIIVEPRKIREGNDYSGLLAEHRAGRVINLYHYAVALTADMPACSSTFAGIGFSGIPYVSLDADGILHASGYNPDLIVLLSDRSVVPRVLSDAAILIIDSSTDPDELGVYPNLYKLTNVDLILLLSARGASSVKTSKFLAKIKELQPSLEVFKAIENPSLLNKPETKAAFLVYSERDEIVSATRDYIEKKYSIKIKGVFDSSAGIPNQTELKNKSNKGKICFILDLFDDSFAEWLHALTKADIPVSVLSRELAPSPKRAFDTALKTLLKKTYTSGQRRLAAAEELKDELRRTRDTNEGNNGVSESDATNTDSEGTAENS